MDHDIESYIVTEQYLADHRDDKLRSGEGAVAVLKDGSLYAVYGDFKGGSDEDRATLVERRSADGGRTWTPPTPLVESPPDALNVMSVSLLTLSDQRLAAIYLRKNSKEDCRPWLMTSADDARTWSEATPVTGDAAYHVVNNDRLVQLSDGRLLLPYCLHGSLSNDPWDSWCGCFISDDLGVTWRTGREKIKIESRHVILPHIVDASRPDADADIRAGKVACQEPGVVALLDGRILMWCRTPGGYAYRALSSDGGETWGPFEPMLEFAMPCGPQSIKRLPGADRLIMLYNDRAGVPYGHPQFGWRRPLAVAVSDDDAKSWKRHGLLEPDTVPSNCYFSICFQDDNAIFTYYEGVFQTSSGGILAPRNLTSLKLKVIKQSYFKL